MQCFGVQPWQRISSLLAGTVRSTQDKRQDLEPIPKLAMNANEFTPDNNSAGKLKQSHVVDSFLLIANQKFRGLPLAIVLSGANTHDIKLLEETLDHIVVLRPEPDEEHPQNLCLDAGYTGSTQAVEQRKYIPHIRPRGEEKKELERNPDFCARRWVVEPSKEQKNP